MFDVNLEVSNYFSLVEKIVKSEYSSAMAFVEYDDLISIGLEGLFIGVKSFNEQVAKEVHYSQNIRLKISQALTRSIERKEKEAQHGFSCVSMTASDGTDWVNPTSPDSFVMMRNQTLKDAKELLADSIDIQILGMMLDEYTQHEMAESVGISQQAVNRRIKKIRNILKDNLFI